MVSEDTIKNAFSKVKEDIELIKEEISKLNKLISQQNQEIHTLKEKSKIEAPMELSEPQDISKPQISPFKPQISTGNHGVFRQTDNRQTTDRQQTDTRFTHISQVIEPMKQEIEQSFRSMTDKEFLIFLSLYQLEEEFNRPVTYSDIALRLKLSQSSIRDHINELLLKNAPIEKVKINNRKVSLFIKKGFRDLNLAGKLINYRNFSLDQRTLFDN